MPLRIPKIRLPIAAKAVFLIAGLGLMSGLANWLCLLRIDTQDRLNGVVAEQVSPARLALEAAKTRVESFGLATYKKASVLHRQAQEFASRVRAG